MASSAMGKSNTDCVLGISILSTNFNKLIHAPNRLLLAVYTDNLTMLDLRYWFFAVFLEVPGNLPLGYLTLLNDTLPSSISNIDIPCFFQLVSRSIAVNDYIPHSAITKNCRHTHLTLLSVLPNLCPPKPLTVPFKPFLARRRWQRRSSSVFCSSTSGPQETRWTA